MNMPNVTLSEEIPFRRMVHLSGLVVRSVSLVCVLVLVAQPCTNEWIMMRLVSPPEELTPLSLTRRLPTPRMTLEVGDKLTLKNTVHYRPRNAWCSSASAPFVPNLKRVRKPEE